MKEVFTEGKHGSYNAEINGTNYEISRFGEKSGRMKKRGECCP